MNWLIKRKLLIKSILIDTSLILLILFSSNKIFYLDLTFLKISIIFIEWLILSYVFDRYYDYVRYKYLGKYVSLGINFTKTLGISLFFIFTLKLLNFLNFELGFLHIYNIYFIFYLSFVSSLLNCLLSFIYSGTKLRNEIWLFIGTKEKLNRFKKEITDFNLKIEIKAFSEHFLSDPFKFPYKGVIVWSLRGLNDETLLTLKNFKNKGISVVDSENWCSRYLERYPIDLVDETLLIEDLGINKSSMLFRIKRIGDIIISLILAIIAIPIVIICSLIIYLEDGGPIFYKQIRTDSMKLI